ncbi:MAG: hypothetical protein ABI831_10005 [Betaproteobacteria bacterium]
MIRGDRLLVTTAGGDFGELRTRHPDAVRQDVANGKGSAPATSDIHGFTNV